MGFVQFPGSATEGPKSGPATAARISDIYNNYLHDFDQTYMRSVVEQRKKTWSHMNTQLNPHAKQLQTLIGMADKTAEQLRLAHIPESMIEFIEKNRARLQHSNAEQNLFVNSLRPSQPGPETNQFSSTKMPAVPNAIPPNNMSHVMPNQPPRPSVPANSLFRNNPQQIQLAMAHISKLKADILARREPYLLSSFSLILRQMFLAFVR